MVFSTFRPLTKFNFYKIKMLKTVAYLAPEIPSVSGTFVYQEIIALQQTGLRIIPISVHNPSVVIQDSQVKQLAKNTTYLYQRSVFLALLTSIKLLLQNPGKYFPALLTVLSDIADIGIHQPKSWKLLYQFLYASQVAKTIKTNNCQYLHIHFANVPTQIGMYASLLTGIPFSFTAHANDLFANRLLLAKKAARAEKAITISAYNRDFLIKQGIDSSKIEIIRCGIDTSKHHYLPKDKIAPVPKIGSLGRLIAKKGMEDLILAVSKLNEQGIDFQLEIAGSGDLQDSLREIATIQGIQDKIEFKGAIPHEQVYDWMKDLDIFVLACKQDADGDQDGIPVVLMEAMTIGIPVVSTQISGIGELISHQESGFLAQPNDPKSLAQSIEQLLAQSDSLTQITQAARNRIEAEFELDTNVERLLAVFNT